MDANYQDKNQGNHGVPHVHRSIFNNVNDFVFERWSDNEGHWLQSIFKGRISIHEEQLLK